MKRMITRKPFSNMTGLTMLETMLSIAVGLSVIGGAVIFYKSTQQSGNASKTVTDLNTIVAAYSTFASAGNALTASVTVASLQTAGFLPTPLPTAWGGAYSAAYDTATGKVKITVGGIAGTNDKNCSTISNLVKNAGATITDITAADCILTYTP